VAKGKTPRKQGRSRTIAGEAVTREDAQARARMVRRPRQDSNLRTRLRSPRANRCFFPGQAGRPARSRWVFPRSTRPRHHQASRPGWISIVALGHYRYRVRSSPSSPPIRHRGDVRSQAVANDEMTSRSNVKVLRQATNGVRPSSIASWRDLSKSSNGAPDRSRLSYSHAIRRWRWGK
jgi:hypothetical protein